MKRIAALLTVLLIVMSLVTCAFADFGDYASSSDYGGSWDSGSSSSWDSDSSSGSDFASGFLGGMLGSSIGGKVSPVVIIIVIIIIVLMMRKKKGGSAPVAPGATPTAASMLSPISTFRDRDPAFSEAVLTEKISNLYVKLQNAWTAKDLEPVRPYLSEDLYAKSERQVQTMKNNKQTNYIDRIAVLGVTLSGWYTDGTNDSMVARLNTRIDDYVVDDTTGNVIRGDKNKELFMEYEWTFVRKAGMTTPASDDLHETNCPNCGAPINVAQNAKCPYCGTVITNTEHDWVLTQIKGLSQRSGN